jgi:prepilin-type N-terminal cleavage/methylation domain-containing protein/prepilin-type processing-associated H-X9-DG protein
MGAARKRNAMQWKGRRGWTLVELLMVTAIIGTLVAILLPAVQQARESARRAQCQNNLRQIGVALTLHAERDGAYPVGCIGCKPPIFPAATPPAPQRFISWNVQLLPLIEESPLYQLVDWGVASYHRANRPASATVVDAFLCPSTEEPLSHSNSGLWKGAAFTDFGGLYGVEGPGHDADPNDPNVTQWLRPESLGVMLYEEAVAPPQVTDGLSKTACVGEMAARRLPTESEWVNGHNLFAQERSTPINGPVVLVNEIGSPHPGGASLVFCDAHVDFVAETIEQSVLNAMLTKAGGETP